MNRRGFLQTSMTLGAAWSISSANEQIPHFRNSFILS